MKAILYTHPGPPEALRCEDIPKPTPADDEVLLRVGAASVNPMDWRMMRGGPFFLRLLLGMRQQKVTRPGRDVAACAAESRLMRLSEIADAFRYMEAGHARGKVVITG